MQKKTDGFDEFSLRQAAAMAKSEAGQQLLGLLQSQHGDQLHSAMQQAKAGNFAQVKEMMEAMMASEQAQQLLKKMQE
ncbi:MAG: hypothetical protein IJE24_01725 [Oscillospiraceae bacterium]|nr:hypothetical protein [Oscillospiraceae bacterium]